MQLYIYGYNLLSRFIHFHDWRLNGSYYTYTGVKKVQKCATCGSERVVE